MKTSEKANMHNEQWLTSTTFSLSAHRGRIKLLRGYVSDGVAWPIPSISGAHAHYAYNSTAHTVVRPAPRVSTLVPFIIMDIYNINGFNFSLTLVLK